MSYLGDTLTVGLILILLFGSIALYLYTRVQQTEQKVGLLESIVLDLKLTGEIQSFTESPSCSSAVSSSPVSSSAVSSSPVASSAVSSSPVASSPVSSSPVSSSLPDAPVYTPFQDEEEQEIDNIVTSDIDFLPLEPVPQEDIAVHPVSSYDGFSLKELQAQVRSRGLSVERGAKKHNLIELLKQQDAAEAKQDQMSSLAPLESTLLNNE